jgi:hypothetical protein
MLKYNHDTQDLGSVCYKVSSMLMCFVLPSEIAEGIAPRHRFMSAYEQKVEPPDRKWQYLLFAAEPYETIAFKVRILLSWVLLFSELLF